MGIRGRIVLLSSLAVAAAVIAAALGAYVAVRNELRGQADQALETQVQVSRDFASNRADLDPPNLRRRLRDSDPAPALPDAATMPQRVTPAGRVARFPQMAEPLPITDRDKEIARQGEGEEFSDRTIDGQHYRVVTAGVGEQGAVMLARSLEGVDGVLANLRLVLGLLIVVGTAVAGALALLIARRVVAPITELSDAAEEISETQDLSRQITVEGDDEVARLARRFSVMLETLRRQQADLSQSVESQRQLVADASHELRTPVAAVRTDIETLMAHPDVPPSQRCEILAAADRRIEDLSELILDIIDLARGEHESEHAADEDVRLDEVVAEAVQRLEQHSPKRRVSVEARPSVVWGRPDRLYRAINNLLENADKYSPAERPIEVSVSEGLVAVRDHGPGIPEAELPHLFDRFWRGSTSRHRAGSGLGLAIVRQVAEASGGEIEAANCAGGGACFTLRLSEAATPTSPEPCARARPAPDSPLPAEAGR